MDNSPILKSSARSWARKGFVVGAVLGTLATIVAEALIAPLLGRAAPSNVIGQVIVWLCVWIYYALESLVFLITRPYQPVTHLTFVCISLLTNSLAYGLLGYGLGFLLNLVCKRRTHHRKRVGGAGHRYPPPLCQSVLFLIALTTARVYSHDNEYVHPLMSVTAAASSEGLPRFLQECFDTGGIEEPKGVGQWY